MSIDLQKLSDYKVIIFDFDQTLFTLDLPWHEYLEKTYQILAQYDQALLEKMERSSSNYEIINAFTDKYGSEPRDKCVEYGQEFEVEQLQGVTIHQELVDWLTANAVHHKMYVWSSNCTPVIEKILNDQGLIDHFEYLITRDSVLKTKPDAEGFARYVLPNLSEQFSTQDCVMVGDSASDQAAAAAAQIEYLKVDPATVTWTAV